MNGTRLLRRVFALLLLLALVTVMTGCSTITISPRYVTLSDDYTTLTATPDSEKVYRIEIDNMSFTNSKDVTIDIAYSDTPSVEVVVSEDLLDYGFKITMNNGVLRVGPSRHLEIRTDRFELKIRARFDEIDFSGGYDVTVDADGAQSLSLNVSGAANGSVDNLYVSDFDARSPAQARLCSPARQTRRPSTFPARATSRPPGLPAMRSMRKFPARAT